ncbi:MAG: metallophosphoesterase [Filimonas sp.]|nr:metallophosphoesterase [Filimonas sp.]
MRTWASLWVILLVMLLLDVYVFLAIRTVSKDKTKTTKRIIYSIYWFVAAVGLLTVGLFPYTSYFHISHFFRNYMFAIAAGLFIFQLIAAIFIAIDDVRRSITWIIRRTRKSEKVTLVQADGSISRSTFLSWLGIGLGGTFFGTLVYGFTNKYNYKLREVTLSYPNLPEAFKGLKIVQLSDIHSGSFNNKAAVQHGVEMVKAQNADLILFTGDLVNDRSEEMENYMDVFNQVKAPMGVFSTLGNHDYGDYIQWESPEAKTANLEKLKKIHADLGWRLLMNEHVVLERGGQQIALLGIENWGAKGRFPKYGKMAEAYAGTEKYPFKILMSHDPSHWDAEVRIKYPDVDLMLAGHTHGMQFGVELPHFKWSPVQWMYKQWAGLYTEGKQQLYVNRGYGFIGYPGRVGILPEITVIKFV